MCKFQIQTLGQNGRFGNQLWQLTLGIALARKYNTKVEIPEDWVCRPIFASLPIEYVTFGFPNGKTEIRTPVDYIPKQADVDHYPSIDLYGYWQNQSTLDLVTKSDLLSWFKFSDWIYEMFSIGFQGNEYQKESYIAIHERRGDYISQFSHVYCCISHKSYEILLGEIDGEPILTDRVNEENPYISPTLKDMNLGFMPDFMRLVNSACLIRSNSTFGWWAGVFCKGTVYSPLVEDKVGWKDVEFVKGNWPRCADSKNHPGTKLTDLYLKD